MPIQEPMDSPCPICAYVPAIGRQDPSALKTLLETKMNAIIDKEGHFPLSLNPGVSLSELITAPLFQVLLPPVDRFLIQARIYGLSTVILIALCVLAVLITQRKEVGFGTTAICVAVFFALRNRLLISAFSKAFNKHWKSLMHENKAASPAKTNGQN